MGLMKKMIDKFLDSGKIVEDLRNVYVAITRPRKVLVMAVPNCHKKIWYELLFDEGYREKGQSSLFEFGKYVYFDIFLLFRFYLLKHFFKIKNCPQVNLSHKKS